MVIKNKEEREARLRAEAFSASQLNSMPIASVCTSGNVSATSTPTSIYHSSQSNIHASDATQSGQLSLQLDPGGSGIVATLPMNLSGSHMSFAHANSQRGTSVMVRVHSRCDVFPFFKCNSSLDGGRMALLVFRYEFLNAFLMFFH